MDFLDGFFENRGWLKIVQRNPTTGSLLAGGVGMAGIPSYTIATMPDASAVAVGSMIRLPRSEFVNSGGGAANYMPAVGIRLEADGVNWVPAFGRQILAVVGTGTETTPILADVIGSGVNSTNAFVLPSGSPSIPAELMYAGLRVSVEMIMGKADVSTGSTIPMVLFGSNATLTSNSHMIKGATIGTGVKRQAMLNSFITVTSSGQFSGPVGDPSAGSAPIFNAGSATNNNAGLELFQTYPTSISFAAGAKNYIVPAFYAAAGGVADTHNLFYFRVVLEA